jgi:hypothetical protein
VQSTDSTIQEVRVRAWQREDAGAWRCLVVAPILAASARELLSDLGAWTAEFKWDGMLH